MTRLEIAHRLAVYRDMRAARTIEYEDIDADYSALTIEETTSQEAA